MKLVPRLGAFSCPAFSSSGFFVVSFSLSLSLSPNLCSPMHTYTYTCICAGNLDSTLAGRCDPPIHARFSEHGGDLTAFPRGLHADQRFLTCRAGPMGVQHVIRWPSHENSRHFSHMKGDGRQSASSHCGREGTSAGGEPTVPWTQLRS